MAELALSVARSPVLSSLLPAPDRRGERAVRGTVRNVLVAAPLVPVGRARTTA